MIRRPLFAACAAVVLTAGSASLAQVDAARLSDDTRVLASDAFAGRAPGGPGEQATVDFLVARFKALGLTPAGENGGWTQTVPLLRFQVGADPQIFVTAGGRATALKQGEGVYVSTLRPVDKVAVKDAAMVFVGYGVSAPERGWDDFKGVDLKGKIAVFLINDPDFEAQAGDDAHGKFGGQAATYYARWTYKYEEAARRGAVGALIVHETPGAGYGWSTVKAPGGEGYDIVRPDGATDKLMVQGWMQRDVAADLLMQAGLDLEQLKLKARRRDFAPVEIKGATFSADYAVSHVRADSRNVVAMLPGAKRPKESVMYAAHWDAYGIGAPDAQGRTIRPGAADDAIGVAGVLEMARLFAAGPRPDRSIVFAAWTAEERGLLGSEYYGLHPTLPLETTAANFTMDVLQTAGPSKDVVLIGYGQNTLEDELAAAAKRQGRVITPDAHPERALFYRADHFSLAKRGPPVLLLMGLGGGPDLVEGGRAAGERWVSDYTSRCYHQTCDAWSADWDLRGAAQDVQLIYEVGRDLASSKRWPNWRDGSEFRAVRDKSAGQRR